MPKKFNRHHGRHRYREKPRMCDPGMCDHCQYIGEGDFVCTQDPTDPMGVLVVSDWTPTKDHLKCKRRYQTHGKKA